MEVIFLLGDSPISQSAIVRKSSVCFERTPTSSLLVPQGIPKIQHVSVVLHNV